MRNGVSGAPDWVMLGTRWGDSGVTLFASNKLTYGELEIRHSRMEDILHLGYTFAPPPEISMRAEMADVVMINADTYAEALAKLAAHWQPAEPDRNALPAPTREIER